MWAIKPQKLSGPCMVTIQIPAESLFLFVCLFSCEILVPPSGMEPAPPPAVEVHSLNHGITREVHSSAFYWPQLGHVPKTMNHGQCSELSS